MTNQQIIDSLRRLQTMTAGTAVAVRFELAADLVQAHIDTGLELESWPAALAFIRQMSGSDVDINDRWPDGPSARAQALAQADLDDAKAGVRP